MYILSFQNLEIKSQFTSSECKNACWNGIEPGVSNDYDVQQILRELEINFAPIEGFLSDDVAVYEWMITISRGDTFASVTLLNDMVTQVALPIEECFSLIVASYGEPSEIYEKDRYYFLLYKDDKIVFSTNEYHDLSKASVAFIVNDDTLSNFQYSDGELEWNDIRDMFLQECE